MTKRRLYQRELIPAGPTAQAEAEKALRRMVVEIDEERNPRTAATVAQLLERHFALLEIEPKTLITYRSLTDRHVIPLLGKVKVGELRANVFDSFYAELRRCRDHCDRRPHVEHRTTGDHECDGRCRMHTCRPLSRSTVRQIHVILSGALKRGVRWRWIVSNPIEHAEAPPQPVAQPRPPTAQEAARILNDAWQDPDWAVLVWLTMVTGSRRGELCGLRWRDVDLAEGVLSVERAISQHGARKWEKDTKSHRSRRLALDTETVGLLAGHKARCAARGALVDVELSPDAFVFSPSPDGSEHLNPESVGQRYSRRAARQGIKTTIHKLRHYSATELIAAGVDVRTVAGRLGHGGGGTTTLKVYAAWVSEADQRAATGLLTHLPPRPSAELGTTTHDVDPRNPYELIASDIRSQIVAGGLAQGDALPSRKALAVTYGVAVGTAHRAVALLIDWGLVQNRRNHRAVVLPTDVGGPAEQAHAAAPPTPDSDVTVQLAELTLRRYGVELSRVTAAVPALTSAVLDALLKDAVLRTRGEARDIGAYEMDVRYLTSTEKTLTFVAST